MGVKGLFPFLRSMVPQCINPISMEALRGKRIAIDGNLLLYREYTSPWLPVAQPKKHILWAIRLLRLCRAYDISPIVVFDSPRTTPAKAKERAKRTLQRNKVKFSLKTSQDKASRLNGLASTMAAIENLDNTSQEEVRDRFSVVRDKMMASGLDPSTTTNHAPLATELPMGELLRIDESLQAELSDQSQSRKEVAELSQRLVHHIKDMSTSGSNDVAHELALLMSLLHSSSEMPMSELRKMQSTTADLVDKLTRRTAFPRQQDLKRTRLCLEKFQIPVQVSPDHFEGECTASSFVRAGYADYVATDDSDVLVYGVPQLRGFMAVHAKSHKAPATLGEMRVIDPVNLRTNITTDGSAAWSELTFLDFAILCGTDFSTSINGLGIRKVARLMDTHRSLENGLKHLPSIVYKHGTSKGKSRFVIHDDFELDSTIARTIFTSYPAHDGKSMIKRLRTLQAVDRAFRKFQRLCKDSEKWESLEGEIVREEELSLEDLGMLEDPDLYRQHLKNKVLPLSFTLNDNPDRAASIESGLNILL